MAGAGRRAGLQRRHLRGLLGHPRRLLRVRRRRTPRWPARGADLRFDLEITFEESFAGTETTIQIPREEHCETCKGTGAAAGSSRETCDQCRGTGQVRYQQGFLVVARTCGQCGGTGPDRAQALCRPAAGTGRTAQGSARHGADSRRDRRRPAPAHQGEGEHGALGGPPGDLYVVIHVRPHPRVPARRRRSVRRRACALPDHGDGRLVHSRSGPAGEIQVDVSAGTASGTLITFPRQGHAERDGPRPRRALRARGRRGAAQAARRSRRSSSSSSARRCPPNASSRASADEPTATGPSSRRSKTSSADAVRAARDRLPCSVRWPAPPTRTPASACSPPWTTHAPTAVEEIARRACACSSLTREARDRGRRATSRRSSRRALHGHRGLRRETGRSAARRRSARYRVGRVRRRCRVRNRARHVADETERHPSSSSSPRWASARATTRRRGCACVSCSRRTLSGASVVDVGTGSGVLAIAAAGSARARSSPSTSTRDALQSGQREHRSERRTGARRSRRRSISAVAPSQLGPACSILCWPISRRP